MQGVLQHINNVEGVIGSAVFGEKGEVYAHAFPALIDSATIKNTALLTLECIHGLQASQSFDIIDMRYAEGRIIIKAFPGAMLCLLCATTINLKVLVVSLNLATRKLEQLLPDGEPPAAVVIPAPVIPAEPVNDNVFRLPVSHLRTKDAGNSLEQLGMIAVSQPTAKYISTSLGGPFKKLTLVNTSADLSGTWPVMIMSDIDRAHDGTVIIGPKASQKLKVGEGDKIEVRLG